MSKGWSLPKASASFARNGSSNSMVEVSLPAASAENPGRGPCLFAVLMVMRTGGSAFGFSAEAAASSVSVTTGWKRAAGISIVVVSLALNRPRS